MTESTIATSPPEERSLLSSRTVWSAFAYACLAVGLVSRVVPLFDADGRLLYQWPSEDGYLTLQIARNMSLGLGMSVSEGTLPTNGTQPFWTFVWSLLFRVVGSEKVAGVLLVLLAEIAISIAASGAVYALSRQVLSRDPNARAISLVAAGAWFASPVNVSHTMNCLETGGYAFAILVTLLAYRRLGSEPGKWSLPNAAGLGVLLGWVFWTRNDGVFFILGMCVAHWLVGVKRYASPLFGRAFLETIVFGSVSVAVASPWLYNNLSKFGHLMPISGIAESYNASFGHNLHLLPIVLAEYIGVILPIPASFDANPLNGAVLSVFVLGALGLLARYTIRKKPDLDVRVVAVVVYGVGLSLFYGLYFGASHFMSRYFSPLSPFFAIIGAATAFRLATSAARRGFSALPLAAVAAMALVVVGLNYRSYERGPAHGHRQVIEWAAANVPEDAWVGAIQTGTLGFFHDKTYNLDGKVNAEALEAKLEGGIGIPQYVVDNEIRYLIDWAGISKFAELSPIAEHYELIVLDHQRNLAVLARKD